MKCAIKLSNKESKEVINLGSEVMVTLGEGIIFDTSFPKVVLSFVLLVILGYLLTVIN